MSEKQELLTTNRKALTINLDGTRYGTIAEIGAGQEVARIFFQVGGASGAIAKTMSAYDMTFSDAIYGKSTRYVSRDRLHKMLDHEYRLLNERLAGQRGDKTCFFVFADTVAAKSARGTSDGHGWLGVRFQTRPGEQPSEVILHVRLWDKKNILQQEALGIVGVNLLYGAFNYHADPEKFILSLVDNVGADRVEVDMIHFSGPAFPRADNRLFALHLVRHGLTNAVMFSPAGEVLQPSEALFQKAVLVQRGNFRPVTRVHLDMLRVACARFAAEPAVQGKPLVALLELTMPSLLATGTIDHADFLSRVDLIGRTGNHTLISNYTEYHRLTTYFRRYTPERVGLVLGVNSLLELFREQTHEHLDGGILESIGRLFKHGVRLYAYPMRADIYQRYIARDLSATVVPGTGLVTAANFPIIPRLRHLYAHLLENGYVHPLDGADESLLGNYGPDVVRLIQAGDKNWRELVPPPVAELIAERGLFGHR
jgi:hypothetical protein